MIKDNKNKLELFLEYFLWNIRFFIIIPIIVLVFLFIFLLVQIVIKGINIIFNFSSYTVIGDIISILDYILLGVIVLIFSWGIYELFVDEIKLKDNESSKAKILIIHNIDELKEKISKVIIIMLVVYLFKHIITADIKNILDILYLSISTLLLAIAAAVVSIKMKR